MEPTFTTREREVAAMLDCGKKNVEIAKALGIAPGTVKIHKKNISLKRELAKKENTAADALVRYLGDTSAAPLTGPPSRAAAVVDKAFDSEFSKP